MTQSAISRQLALSQTTTNKHSNEPQSASGAHTHNHRHFPEMIDDIWFTDSRVAFRYTDGQFVTYYSDGGRPHINQRNYTRWAAQRLWPN